MRTTLQSLAFIQKETAVLLCRKDVNKTRPLKPSQEHKNDAGDEHNERGADDEDYEHRDDPTVEQIEQPEKKQMLRIMSENQVTMITLDFADQHVNVNNQNG